MGHPTQSPEASNEKVRVIDRASFEVSDEFVLTRIIIPPEHPHAALLAKSAHLARLKDNLPCRMCFEDTLNDVDDTCGDTISPWLAFSYFNAMGDPVEVVLPEDLKFDIAIDIETAFRDSDSVDRLTAHGYVVRTKEDKAQDDATVKKDANMVLIICVILALIVGYLYGSIG